MEGGGEIAGKACRCDNAMNAIVVLWSCSIIDHEEGALPEVLEHCGKQSSNNLRSWNSPSIDPSNFVIIF